MQSAQRDKPLLQHIETWINIKEKMNFWINQTHYPVLFIQKKANVSQITIRNYTSLYKNLSVPVTGTTQTQLKFDTEHYTNWTVDGQMFDQYLYSDNGWVIINLQQGK